MAVRGIWLASILERHRGGRAIVRRCFGLESSQIFTTQRLLPSGGRDPPRRGFAALRTTGLGRESGLRRSSGIGVLHTRSPPSWYVIPVLASAMFVGFLHAYQGLSGAIGVATIRVIFGLVYWRWRQLWPLIVAHSLLDFLALANHS
jgi:hypothetical protein